jgi:membrane dipeptidase
MHQLTLRFFISGLYDLCYPTAMRLQTLVASFLICDLFTASILEAQTDSTPSVRATVSSKARRIHEKAIVIDGHNDLPWELRSNANSSFDQADLSTSLPKFHTDIPRLRKGNVGAQFWVAYVPYETSKSNQAAHQTLEQIDLIHRMMGRYPQTFELARTADDVERIHRQGKIASLIGVEGGHSIENSLSLLRTYHQLGVRYLTLTHSDSLDWADSATDSPKAHGLSDFGREVVREMNRLGMLVDISHVSAETMHAVLDVSKAPIIASHSSAYAVAPTPRNIPDDVLKRMKKNGGIIMVNFYSGFVVPEAAPIATETFAVTRKLRAQYANESEFRKAMREWRADHPIPPGTSRQLVDHIDHIVKIAGVDHVGLGSDYDGVSLLPIAFPTSPATR